MLFTIAIPTYNNAKTVSKAIESAINQDYKDEYEVLIVNNASTDNTAEVLAQYESNHKVRVETNESTVDLFANHNVCFENARGEYVLFIHSDDELYPYALSILDEKIKQRHYPPRYIVWGRSMFFDYKGCMDRTQPLNTVFAGETSVFNFLAAGLTPSGTCYSKNSLLEIGGFPKMKSRSTPLDWFIMLWAAFNCFEFEMIDRLLFKRLYSSTDNAGGYQDNDILDMFNILFSKTSDYQKDYLLKIIWNRAPFYVVERLKSFYAEENFFKKRIINRIRLIVGSNY